MYYRRHALKGLAVLWLLTVTSGCSGRVAGGQHPEVLAFFYPWYGTPFFSGQWRHWNEGGHDPYVTDTLGFRDIGTTDYPYPDVYDSTDTLRIEWQFGLARYAGISGLVVSWWGIDSFEDNALKKLFQVAQNTDAPPKIAVYYEIVPDSNIGNAISDITYIQENYFPMKNYLRYGGKPVVFVYGRAIFPSLWCTGYCTSGTPNVIDWGPVIRKFPDVVFVGDAMAYSLTGYSVPQLKSMGFEGIHIYNPVLDIRSGENMADEYNGFTGLAQRDGLLSGVTVIPGYNDSNIGRTMTSVVDRDNGALYATLAHDAFEASPAPDWVLITTFNEWHEGTEIEPSYQYMDQYINLTKVLFP
ncbi:MAG: hypothetical protein M1491_06735 [Deltaproteobacteria bacterium]|nr:hypothetical protein [Deltaproteobacteria bacterium]MCL5277217.1 hypothetical protein [Deltaproteobacteria bacterium]